MYNPPPLHSNYTPQWHRRYAFMERLLQHRSLHSLVEEADNAAVLFMRRLHGPNVPEDEAVALLFKHVDNRKISVAALGAVMQSYGSWLSTSRLLELYAWCTRGRAPEDVHEIAIRTVDVLADQALFDTVSEEKVRDLLPQLEADYGSNGNMALSLAVLYAALGDDALLQRQLSVAYKDQHVTREKVLNALVRVAMAMLKQGRYKEALALENTMERIHAAHSEDLTSADREGFARTTLMFLQRAQGLETPNQRALFYVMLQFMKRFVPNFTRSQIVVNHEIGAQIDLHGVQLRHMPFLLWKSFGRLIDMYGTCRRVYSEIPKGRVQGPGEGAWRAHSAGFDSCGRTKRARGP